MNKIFKKKADESFEDYCLRISALREDANLTWTNIAAIVSEETGYDYSADRYRKAYKRYVASQPEEENDDEEEFIPSGKESVSVNYEKNETTSTKDIPLTEEQLNDPDALLRAHGFNPDEWQIKSANNAKTNRQTLSGDTSIYSSRLTVKPKDKEEVTFDTIDKYFATFDSKKFKSIKTQPKQYDPDGEFLEICIQDLHLGLLAYAQEAGEDYDVEIAKQRLQHCLEDIYQRAKDRKFKRIVLALLGDILHVDNLDGTTTKGTRQDVDTRPSRIFDQALDILIGTIEQLGAIAPVDVITIAGNHDRFSSYMLYKGVEMAFRDDNNVQFFNGPNPRKWRRYGNVLIGFAHGDMKPNAVSEWLSNECEEWSLAKYREVHMGHLHSLQTIQRVEDNKYGLIARYLPALCASSAWEHEMGYPKSQRGMMCFVWNEDAGLREVWYSNI